MWLVCGVAALAAVPLIQRVRRRDSDAREDDEAA
jgi:hypothetical protein